jgi:hypothetical protein
VQYALQTSQPLPVSHASKKASATVVIDVVFGVIMLSFLDPPDLRPALGSWEWRIPPRAGNRIGEKFMLPPSRETKANTEYVRIDARPTMAVVRNWTRFGRFDTLRASDQILDTTGPA